MNRERAFRSADAYSKSRSHSQNPRDILKQGCVGTAFEGTRDEDNYHDRIPEFPQIVSDFSFELRASSPRVSHSNDAWKSRSRCLTPERERRPRHRPAKRCVQGHSAVVTDLEEEGSLAACCSGRCLLCALCSSLLAAVVVICGLLDVVGRSALGRSVGRSVRWLVGGALGEGGGQLAFEEQLQNTLQQNLCLSVWLSVCV